MEAAFADPGRAPTVPSDAAERERLLHRGFVPWLIRVDPESEAPKRRVARWDEIPADARPLLERLLAQRLLTRDRRRLDGREGDVVVVEVAHEALLRQWPALARWLDEEGAELKTLDAVRRAAAEWAKNGKAGAWLVHMAERLDQAERLLQRPDFDRLLSADGREYLQACRRRDDAARAEPTMPKILVSYRRADTAYVATALHEKLVERFGAESVFLDVDSIPAGRDFRKSLEEAVVKCDVVFAVIDEHWLDARDPNGHRRLDSPSDWVRIELETALARDIRVIPLLVGKAQIPAPGELPESLHELAFRQALVLRPGRDFHHDVDVLGREVERTYGR